MLTDPGILRDKQTMNEWRQQYFHWNVVRTYFWSPYTSQYFATVDKEIHCRERTWFHERLRRGTSVNRFLATNILKVHLHHHRKASFPHTWLEFIPFPGKKLILYDNLWLAFHSYQTNNIFVSYKCISSTTISSLQQF